MTDGSSSRSQVDKQRKGMHAHRQIRALPPVM